MLIKYVSGKNKIKLASVVNTATKVIRNEQEHLSRMYTVALKRKARQTLYVPTNPLNFLPFFSETSVRDTSKRSTS